MTDLSTLMYDIGYEDYISDNTNPMLLYINNTTGSNYHFKVTGSVQEDLRLDAANNPTNRYEGGSSTSYTVTSTINMTTTGNIPDLTWSRLVGDARYAFPRFNIGEVGDDLQNNTSIGDHTWCSTPDGAPAYMTQQTPYLAETPQGVIDLINTDLSPHGATAILTPNNNIAIHRSTSFQYKENDHDDMAYGVYFDPLGTSPQVEGEPSTSVAACLIPYIPIVVISCDGATSSVTFNSVYSSEGISVNIGDIYINNVFITTVEGDLSPDNYTALSDAGISVSVMPTVGYNYTFTNTAIQDKRIEFKMHLGSTYCGNFILSNNDNPTVILYDADNNDITIDPIEGNLFNRLTVCLAGVGVTCGIDSTSSMTYTFDSTGNSTTMVTVQIDEGDFSAAMSILDAGGYISSYGDGTMLSAYFYEESGNEYLELYNNDSEDHKVLITNFPSGSSVGSPTTYEENSLSVCLKAPTPVGYYADWNADGTFLALAIDRKPYIKLYSFDGSALTPTTVPLDTSNAYITTAKFSNDGSLLVLARQSPNTFMGLSNDGNTLPGYTEEIFFTITSTSSSFYQIADYSISYDNTRIYAIVSDDAGGLTVRCLQSFPGSPGIYVEQPEQLFIGSNIAIDKILPSPDNNQFLVSGTDYTSLPHIPYVYLCAWNSGSPTILNSVDILYTDPVQFDNSTLEWLEEGTSILYTGSYQHDLGVGLGLEIRSVPTIITIGSGNTLSTVGTDAYRIFPSVVMKAISNNTRLVSVTAGGVSGITNEALPSYISVSPFDITEGLTGDSVDTLLTFANVNRLDFLPTGSDTGIVAIPDESPTNGVSLYTINADSTATLLA